MPKNRDKYHIQILMKDLAAGTLDAEGMSRLREMAKTDPFVADALEGYSKFSSQKEQTEAIRHKINQQVKKRDNRGRLLVLTKAAAVLLVIIGGIWVIREISLPGQETAALKEIQKDSILPEGQIRGASNAREETDAQRELLEEQTIQQKSASSDGRSITPRESPETYTITMKRTANAPIQDSVTMQESTAPGITNDHAGIETYRDADVATKIQKSPSDVTGPAAKLQAKPESRSLSQKEPLFAFPVHGFKNYDTYIKENLIYPQTAEEAQISGVVTVSFLLDENGKPTDLKIEASLGYGCDEEAMRLIENGPVWIGEDPLQNQRLKYDIHFP